MGDDQLAQHETIHEPCGSGSDPIQTDREGPKNKQPIKSGFGDSNPIIHCSPDDIPDLVCTVDSTERYRYVNPAYKRVLGYEPEELLNESLFARVHPDDRSRVTNNFNRGACTALDFETEYRYQNADGRYVWLRSAFSFLNDGTGAHTGAAIISCDITEYKNTAAALAESEQRFRTLAEAAFEGIAVSEDGVLIDANEQLARIFGYDREELIGMSGLDLLSPESRDAMADAVKSNTNEGLELVALAKDGTTFPVEVRGRMASIGDRRVRLTAVRDVSERKQIEAALCKSEERLRLALEGTSDGIWDWHVETGHVYYSPRWFAMLGYEPNEFPPCYESWRRLVHPDDVEAAEAVVKEALLKKLPFSAEFRLKAKNGDWLWILGRGKVVESSAEGEPIRMAGSHTDITERKLAEEALEKRIVVLTQAVDADEDITFDDLFDKSEIQRLQDLYAEAFGVGALVTRPDGTPITEPSNFCTLCEQIVRQSPTGVRNCHYSDSIIGRYNASGPTIQSCLSAGLCNAGASITVGGRHVANWLIGQVRNESLDEKEIMEYARKIGAQESAFREAYLKVPVMSQDHFDRAARVLFVLANQISTAAFRNVQQARYIAESKRAEKEICELTETLERRVHERTAELEEATKELEAFSYSVSHDLRAPLRAIDGFSGILENNYRSSLDEEGLRVVSIVRDEARRMGRLIDDLLRFSRLSKQPLKREETDMTSLVKEVFELVRREEPNRNVTFHLEALPEIMADPPLLRQLWVNLLGNAVKFSRGRKHPEISVSGKVLSDEAVYSVKDNGAGFNMKYAERLFGVFQRLHGQEEFEGTGVGLALAQRIVHRHGGRIWAEAEVDRGATFHFTLAK